MAKKEKEVKKNDTKAENKGGRLVLWPFYVLFIVSIFLYVIFQKVEILSIIFGLLTFVSLFLVIGFELESGVKEEGSKKVIIESVAVLVAVIIVWELITLGLNTQYPINVVPSCSMLPALHRGYMIAIEGISNVVQIHAPIVNVSNSEINYIYKPDYPDSLSCVYYNYNDEGNLSVSQYYKPNWLIGLYYDYGGKTEVLNNSSGYPISYNCGKRAIVYKNGSKSYEAYLESIKINNQTISGDANNSITVYKTLPTDLFYKEGDAFIVHRAYVILNDSGKYYVVTKGDNNPGLDMQYYNLPPNISSVEGRVIGSVPYLGYLKLIISGDLTVPAGCNSTVVHSWEK